MAHEACKRQDCSHVVDLAASPRMFRDSVHAFLTRHSRRRLILANEVGVRLAIDLKLPSPRCGRGQRHASEVEESRSRGDTSDDVQGV